MTKTAVKEKDTTLFGDIEPPAKAKNPTSKPAPAPAEPPKPKYGVRGGYTGGTGGKKPKLPTTGTGVTVRSPAKAQAAPEPTNMLAVIARAAANPSVDSSKMRELLDMQKEIMAEEARIAFTEDFIALQSGLPTINAKGRIEIKKDNRVIQSTAFATFNEITKVTRPILQQHRFSISHSYDQSADGRLIVKSFLKHGRGHQETSTLSLPLENSGSKNNVQGVGSSASYGKRYNTIALLNLISEAMEDRDDDGAGKTGISGTDSKPVCLSIEQSAPLVALIKDSVGLERFLEKYKLTAVIDLNPALYDEATKACRDYKAAMAKKEKV